MWYDGGGALTEIEGTLTGAPVTGYLKLLTTDSYLPGVPTSCASSCATTTIRSIATAAGTRPPR
ncbi:MAG: hypothetical protein R3F11_23590 [Verrucomicrobiales bacterium]